VGAEDLALELFKNEHLLDMLGRLTLAAVAMAVAACASDEPSCSNCGDAAAGGDPIANQGDQRGDPGPGDPNPGDSDGSHTCGAATDVTHARLWPEPGELFYIQIGLAGIIAMGESAITVWPSGQILIVDLGNNSHSDDVLGVLDDVITAANAAGLPSRAARTVDHVMITHYHADHTDGLSPFLDDVTVTGRVISRGFFDLVGVNDGTIEDACDALAAHPGLAMPLCTGTGAPCNPASWSGTYAPDTCSGTAGSNALAFSASSSVDIIGVNGFINGESYEDLVEPFSNENNGENARSVTAVLRHGAFRMLVAGDLTGGGSDTDDVEGFYIPRLPAAIGALGIDVLHAGHHARNTSTSTAWANRLLPNDGHDRNVVMGVSEAHIRSPYQEVIDAIFAANRLSNGYGWTTRIATLGTTHARLLDAAGGHIIVRTFDGGAGYYVQATNTGGNVLWTRRYDSVRACP